MDQQHTPAEVHLDEGLVRALLEEQQPEFAAHPLSLVDEGWDNVTYRLGRSHAVRLPRRRIAVDLLLAEQRWLPLIAPRLPLRVSRTVEAGRPSGLFKWPWSVVEWIVGSTADRSPLADDQAGPFGAFLLALHQSAPAEAPSNPFRGVPLEARRKVVEERLGRLGLDPLLPIWRAALDARPTSRRTWIHGDLHGRNVVVRGGVLAGVIDWGDMNGGDVATDLASVWMLFNSSDARAALLEAYQPTAEVHARAGGWAVNLASALLDSGEPRHVTMGAAAVQRLIEG